MVKQQVTLSHPITHAFAELVQAHEHSARTYALWIVRRSHLLQSPDEEDIYAIGMTRIWHAYFRENATQQYHYQSSAHEFSLIKSALRTAALDVIKRRAKERKILSHIELDQPLPDHTDQLEICSTSDFTEWVDLSIDLAALLNRICKQPGQRLVALYLLGLAERDELADYSDTYIRVTAYRLKKQIQHHLAPPHSGSTD